MVLQPLLHQEWLRVVCAGRRLTWGPAIAFSTEYRLLLGAACLVVGSANRQRWGARVDKGPRQACKGLRDFPDV